MATTIHLPLAGSPTTEGPLRLHKSEIFRELALRTCKVVWTIKEREVCETSGCFIKGFDPGRVQVLSCFHDTGWKDAALIQIKYHSQSIKATLKNEICSLEAKKNDLCILNFEGLDVPFFEFTGEFMTPTLGQKIYFSGFPFGQDQPVVHRGYISSTSIVDDSDFFTIDGTVVQGHSGGPVIVVQEDRLNLLGVISSQLVDISRLLINASETKLPNIVAWNDRAPSYGTSNVGAVLDATIQGLLSNLSTGIGKASSLTNIVYIEKDENTEKDEGEKPEEEFATTSDPEVWDTGAGETYQDMFNADPFLSIKRRREFAKAQSSKGEPAGNRKIAATTSAMPEEPSTSRVSELPVTKKSVVLKVLLENRWRLIRTGKHETWTNGKGQSEILSHGGGSKEIKDPIAKKIIKNAQEHPGN